MRKLAALTTFAAFVTAIGLAGVAMAGDVPGHDTCEVSGEADDIYNLSAFFDSNGNSDPTDDVIVVEMKLCADPSQPDNRTKYRVHFDHTPPLFSVDGTSEDRNGDGFIDEDDFCATTSDDTMMRRRNKDTGPGIIEFIEEDGMFFLLYTVLVDDLNPSLVLGDTVYIWADTQHKGIIDRAPDTDGLSDGCSKPEVASEVVALTLEDAALIIFQTTERNRGDLGGLAGADAICNRLADAEGLPGDYVAWLSDSITDAIDRLNGSLTNIPYELLNGARVADNLADLTDGSIATAIIIREDGTPTGGGAFHPWTGTNADGTKDGLGRFCNDWTSDSVDDDGLTGRWVNTDSGWTAIGTTRCNGQRPAPSTRIDPTPLICIQNTVP